jgi:hypothetical protein
MAGAVTGFVATRRSVLATVLIGIASCGAIWWILERQNQDDGPYVAVGAVAGLMIAGLVLLPRRMARSVVSP